MIAKKYRSIPVTIEAMQLEKGTDNYKDICDWIHANGGEVSYTGDGQIAIQTLEGVMVGMPGDYIIKGLIGEFYPCKPEVFNQKYVLDLSDRPVG